MTVSNYAARLKEISRFFLGKDEVHLAMRRLVRRLDRAGINYALIGGMAVNAHHYRPTTNDVEVLLPPDGLAAFRQRFVPRWYAPVPDRARRFTERSGGVRIDVLLTGLYPGSGRPGPFAFPDPETV